MSRALIVAGGSHLAEALLKEAMKITGKQHHAWYVNYECDEQFDRELEGLLDLLKDEKIVVLCDFRTSDAALQTLSTLGRKKRNALVMTGASVPMVISALMLRDAVDEDEQLMNSLVAESKSGVSGMLV